MGKVKQILNESKRILVDFCAEGGRVRRGGFFCKNTFPGPLPQNANYGAGSLAGLDAAPGPYLPAIVSWPPTPYVWRLRCPAGRSARPD